MILKSLVREFGGCKSPQKESGAGRVKNVCVWGGTKTGQVECLYKQQPNPTVQVSEELKSSMPVTAEITGDILIIRWGWFMKS